MLYFQVPIFFLSTSLLLNFLLLLSSTSSLAIPDSDSSSDSNPDSDSASLITFIDESPNSNNDLSSLESRYKVAAKPEPYKPPQPAPPYDEIEDNDDELIANQDSVFGLKKLRKVKRKKRIRKKNQDPEKQKEIVSYREPIPLPRFTITTASPAYYSTTSSYPKSTTQKLATVSSLPKRDSYSDLAIFFQDSIQDEDASLKNARAIPVHGPSSPVPSPYKPTPVPGYSHLQRSPRPPSYVAPISVIESYDERQALLRAADPTLEAEDPAVVSKIIHKARTA